MIDTIIVALIIAAAVAFLGYRYFYKKTGGCSCSTGSCCRSNHADKRSCGCRM